MSEQNAENSRALSTVECLNVLSVASGLCSTALVYAMVLGPLFLFVPWLLFYGLKRNESYFRGWDWPRALGVAVASYVLGVALGTLELYLLMGAGSLVAAGVLAAILIVDLIYGIIVFAKRIFQSA